MLDRIRKSPWYRRTNLILLAGAACTLSSCATKEPQPLVSDSSHGRESSIPWNSQEKWESQGQLGPMAESLNSR